jgi:hypothetical protein
MYRGRQLIGVAACVSLLACIGAFAAPASRHAVPRSTVDRADDVRGPQIHVIYAIPSDGADRALDTDGSLEASVRAWNGWLASQTGGKGGLRIDTAGGTVDVTFFRDPHPQAEIDAQESYVRDFLERDLHAAGLNATGKVYAVYYDGTSSWSCGGGAWPPELPGNVAAMYLHGTPPGGIPCDTNTLAPGGAPGYLDFGMLHELMHTLGFVATCAPHQTRAGHVPDTNDLMYGGDAPWQLPPTLDVGHDDYFQTGRTDCLDLAQSPYLESNAPPAAAPVVKPKAKAQPKPKPPKCKKGQRSTKRKPCRRP